MNSDHFSAQSPRAHSNGDQDSFTNLTEVPSHFPHLHPARLDLPYTPDAWDETTQIKNQRTGNAAGAIIISLVCLFIGAIAIANSI